MTRKHLLKEIYDSQQKQKTHQTGVIDWQRLLEARNATEAYTVTKTMSPELERLSILERENQIKTKCDYSELPEFSSKLWLFVEVLDSTILPELRKMSCLEIDIEECEE